jgi:hypothetical protein
VAVTTNELSKEDLTPVLEAGRKLRTACAARSRSVKRRGQLIANVEIDRNQPPGRVAAWFSDRLHRLIEVAGVD